MLVPFQVSLCDVCVVGAMFLIMCLYSIGIATESEVNRQRAKLEDALMSEGIQYDPASFKVYQYNPPLTLPWVRRNEVLFSVVIPEFAENRSKTEDELKFYSAPEAGD